MVLWRNKTTVKWDLYDCSGRQGNGILRLFVFGGPATVSVALLDIETGCMGRRSLETVRASQNSALHLNFLLVGDFSALFWLWHGFAGKSAVFKLFERVFYANIGACFYYNPFGPR